MKPLNLFPERSILQHREEFKYLHIGLVQVGVKPFKLGIDSPVLVTLRDKRHLNYSNSLLATLQSNLKNGPAYFNCRPNFTVSLQDPHILSTLTLDIHSKGLELDSNTHSMVVMYRACYRLMHTAATSPRALKSSPIGLTLVFETNFGKSSTTVTKCLSWDQITQDPTWRLGDEFHV